MNGISLSSFEKEFEKLKKQAEKEQYSNIRVEFRYDDGSEDRLAYGYLILTGERLETEIEWHTRLYSRRSLIKRNIEQTKREIENANSSLDEIKKIEDEIKKIELALEKSSIKCEKCGSIDSCLTHMYSWKKSKRLCVPCSDKMRK